MQSAQVAIGIDIGGTNVRAARVSASGQLLEAYSERTVRDAPSLLVRLIELIRKIDRPEIRSIGIGVPGRVDAKRGTALSGGYVDLSALPLASLIEAQTGRRVFIDNDCNMALQAEIAVGAARGCRDVAMFTIGTGIGGAIVSEGRVVRGVRSAGQLGHITVDPVGPICNCGRRGCVETTSSGSALRRHIDEAGLSPDTDITRIFELRDAGEPRAVRVIEAWIHPLRAAIDSVVAAMDPELVLLGGGLGEAACRALETAPAISPWYQCLVRPASLGDDAGVIGAAMSSLSSFASKSLSTFLENTRA